MKKITLLLVFLIALASENYAQCIRTSQFPFSTVVSNNLGLPQQIAINSYTSEFAELSNILIGSDYVFTCRLTDADKYITVTDLTDNVIAFGDSPLTVSAITSSDIKVHFSNDAACGFTNVPHITTVQLLLSCPPPNDATIANITTTSADFSWELGGSETAWEVLVLTSGSTAPVATTSGIAVTTNPIYLATSLNPATSYQFYVRSNCGSEFSPWSLPLNFATACNAVTALTENFDASTNFPVCWEKVGTTGSAYVQQSTSSSSLPNNLYMYSGSATEQAIVALPSVSNAGAGTHRLKFKAKSSFPVGGVIEVGYLTDIADASSFVSLQSFTTTSTSVYDIFIAELGVDPLGYDHLAFRNLGTPSASVVIDDVIWEPIPACPDVSGLTSISSTTNTTDIEWVAGGSETNWQYAIGATSVTDPNTLTPIGINTTSATITSLSPQTTYKVWVRSDCGTSYGVWVGPITITTACVPLSTLPWFENFDSLTTGTNVFPSCWAYTNTSSDWSIATFPPAYSGANSLRRTWSTDGWAFTPLATLTAGTSYTLSYFMRTNDDIVGYDLTVGVGNGQTEAEMTETLSTVTGYQGPNWTKFSYEFIPTSSGDYSFGVHVTAPNPPNGINFDDFKLAITPTCIEPTELVTTDVTVNSATVSWTESSTVPANGYQYYLASNGIAPTTSTAPTGSVASGITTTVLSGLLPATSYCVWVRSACSLSDLSDWSTSSCFTTECVPLTTLTENFDASTNFPVCWEKVGTTGSANVQQSTSSNSLPNNLYMYSGSATDQALVALPSVSNAGAGTHRLKFKARANFTIGGVIEVGYLTDVTDATSFVSLQSFTTTSTSVYDIFSAELGVDPLGYEHLAFRNLGTPANSILIDDVIWEPIPACPDVIGLTSISSTTITTDIEWTSGGSETNWQYVIGASTVTDPNTLTPVGINTTTATIASLSPQTTYKIWVRSDCGTSYGVWIGPLSVTTECAPVTSNYTQDFNATTFPANCWTLNNEGDVSTGPTGTGTGIWFADSFLNAGSTNNSIKVNLYFTNRIGWIISPTFDLTGGNKTVSFDYGVTAWNLTTPLAMGTDDSVKLIMSEDDGATWSEISTFDASNNISNTLQSFSYDLTSTSATTKFALLATDGIVNDDNDYDFFIDNFRVGATLATSTFDNASFTYYPNPVKGVLNLSYNKNISKVAVYNLVGQEVATKSINANQSQIDMSNLSRGTYLVKVTADNQVKTIKVIKE